MTVEQYSSVEEVAAELKLSRDTVRRLFEQEAGVIVLQKPYSRFKRRYRTLRIPQSVKTRVLEGMTN
jgi:transcriptional regulator GlxA family with amidase domain